MEAIFRRIAKDSRHGSLLLLKRGEIEKRSFGDWRMGFLAVSPESKATLDGFSDFLRGGALALRGDTIGVERVFAAFRDGRYHPQLK